MKLQVLEEDISKMLNTSIRFVSSRQTLPILANFMLTAEKTKLKVQATNLEMSISMKLGAKIEEEGSVTVPAKSFLRIIFKLNPGQLNLVLTKEQLKIDSLGFVANIATMPANDFPKIPKDIDEKKSFQIPTKVLLPTLSKILFAASNDETRPVLGGVLFIFNTNELTLVASDGFRLSKKTITLTKKIPGEKLNMIIPKSMLLELIKITSDEETIFFEPHQSDNQLIIKVGDVIISTRLIDGNFPDFERIIPKNSSTKVVVDKNDLKRGVKLGAVFARESANVIKLKIKEGSILLESESGKVGKENYEIEANIVGGEVEISFNYKFIEDFINSVTADDLEIKLTDGSSPAIFVDPKDPDFLHLIMPVKIQG